MLHDLLLALYGHPGNIFKELTVGKIEVVSGLPHISPNEETALNRLLDLATKFMFFQKFMQAHTSTLYAPNTISSASTDGLKQGCYLKAFCLGLDSVLSEYRQRLLKVEKDILADPHLSLLHISFETEKFHILFNAIYDVITTIKLRKSHGCQILDVLFRASRSGNMLVKEAILKIMQHCHLVMYKQLSGWILHGLLIDRHGEFFITSKSEEDSQSSKSSEKDFQFPSSQAKEMDDFEVCLHNLPCYIPPRIAHVICFIGSSLHLFESNKHNSNDEKANLSDVLKGNSSDAHLTLEGILHEKEVQFLDDLKSLQQAKEFIVEDFEICIDKIRGAVARKLWELCVEQAQLVSYLNMLKDFFLLGRGELFLVFIDEAAQLLKSPPSRVTQHDVQQAFLRSAAKIQIEDEIPFQLFHLTINPYGEGNKFSPFADIYTIDDGWSRLGMTVKVQWPLHTIFKPNVLERYNHLFRFLLRVRRTQAALQHIWTIQMRRRQSLDVENESSIDAKTGCNFDISQAEQLQWQCRSQMQFFVDNLQYYLQADVLESHFTNMLNKIRTTNDSHRDFESITLAHENFLNSLMSQCFVMSNTVCSSLVEILDLCQQFCDMVVTSSLLLSKQDIHSQVEEIWDQFSKKTFVFFQVLSGVCSNQCNPHISQLTLRLDYNRYFSAMINKSKKVTKSIF